jgi:methylglutaconyl-CoA hydratase
MAYQTLTLGFHREIATITLNRPDKRNAISTEMIQELLAALSEAQESSARVTILTGSGKAFCAGMDIDALRQIASQPAHEHLSDSKRMGELFYTVYAFPKPLIAAVNGAAVAGGCGLATLADITLAVPEAKFGYTEARIGFLPAIVSVFLLRQIGEKRARDLLLTGRLIDAAEARDIGLVNEIVPAEKLMARAVEQAETLIANSPVSLARTKRLLLHSAERELGGDLMAAIEENASIRATHDFREGVASFLEKRKPVWKGE